jgi:hypothetical protein
MRRVSESSGRAGWRAQVLGRRAEAAHFGRRDIPELRLESLDDPETAILIHRWSPPWPHARVPYEFELPAEEWSRS